MMGIRSDSAGRSRAEARRQARLREIVDVQTLRRLHPWVVSLLAGSGIRFVPSVPQKNRWEWDDSMFPRRFLTVTFLRGCRVAEGSGWDVIAWDLPGEVIDVRAHPEAQDIFGDPVGPVLIETTIREGTWSYLSRKRHSCFVCVFVFSLCSDQPVRIRRCCSSLLRNPNESHISFTGGRVGFRVDDANKTEVIAETQLTRRYWKLLNGISDAILCVGAAKVEPVKLTVRLVFLLRLLLLGLSFLASRRRC